MEIIDPFLVILLFLFFSGIGLFISGVKITSENKTIRIVSIVFGIILILAAILTGIVAIINSLAYFD